MTNHQYSTNPSDSVLNFLKADNNFLLIGHTNPDGDAIGAMLGMSLILKKLGKNSTILIEEELPAEFRFLDGSSQVKNLESTSIEEIDYNAIIICDASEFERTGKIATCIDTSLPTLVIDHHVIDSNQSETTDKLLFIDSHASSTAELIYRIAKRLTIPLDSSIATLLLTGIIVDTGLFAYANTTSKTLTVAADLVEHGAKIDNISEQLFNQQNLETLLALKNLIASIELYEDGKIALCSFSLEDILAESFSKVNIEGMASVPLKIKTVKISGFIRVINPNLCKVSLRAKQGYDVHSIANHFGGGGHILAAGCHIEQDLLAAKSQLLALIKKRMIKVAEL